MISITFALLATAALGAPHDQPILIEAERFDDTGGWVVDTQFMDQMGSPYLLAHGLGVPVEDARTRVSLSDPGQYRLWVRTRDWVAPWDAEGAPGRFQVLVDGQAVPGLFGTDGEEWHWQRGPVVALGESAELTLHDLTGFEGRCDAILLARDPDYHPPKTRAEMDELRRVTSGLPTDPQDAGSYDLVVVGGGMAGMCASLSAARHGLTVALIQDRPVLGGNNSSEVRVWLGGETSLDPYPRIGDVVRELEPARRGHPGTADMYEDERRIELVASQQGLSLFLNHRGNGVEMRDGRISAVIAQHTITGQRKRFEGRWFADCTGDGCIGFLAGADFELTNPGHMGRSNLWAVEDTGQPSPFPECPWAVDFKDRPFPSGEDQLGKWFWESGFHLDPIEHSERIRDNNLRAMYGAWHTLKNIRGELPSHRLVWAAYIAGKRESRRLLGDVVLRQSDVTDGLAYPDGCVPATWAIDLHLPDPRYDEGHEGNEFISEALYTQYERPYWIPYRCLYSRNVPNLLMAGRDISVTHRALGCVRVMRTCGMMGEVVGMAAALCKRLDTTPRGVYRDHLADLKALLRAGVPDTPRYQAPELFALKPVPDAWGRNLAPLGSLEVSSLYEDDKFPPSNIADGVIDVSDNSGRWLSTGGDEHWVTITWPALRKVSAARIVSGYRSGGSVGDPITDFRLQYRVSDGWRDVPGARVTGNDAVDWRGSFEPVATRAIRLLVTETPTKVARIHELEVYHLR